MRNRDLRVVVEGLGRVRAVKDLRYDILCALLLCFRFRRCFVFCFFYHLRRLLSLVCDLENQSSDEAPSDSFFFSLTFYYMASNLGLGCFNSKSYLQETVAVDKVKTFVWNKQFRLLLWFCVYVTSTTF